MSSAGLNAGSSCVAGVRVEHLRGSVRVVQGEGGKPDWRLESEAEDRAVLGRAMVCVFALEGVRAVLGGWSEGGDDERVESISLRHELDENHTRWVEVESTLEEDVDLEYQATSRIDQWNDDRLEVGAELRSFRVDGVQRPFAFASAGEFWAAVGTVGDVTIAVLARGVDAEGLHLRALADPAGLVDAGTPEYRPCRPALDVLDLRRITELADATPLKDLGSALAGLARAGLALVPREGPESSWIGGEPELPDDTPWPHGVHGAMTFLAQLSLADLDVAVWTGPTSGHLHLFCDIDSESTSIKGGAACALLHTPESAALSVRRFPDDLHGDNRIPQRMVTPRIGLTLPDPQAPPMASLDLDYGGERESGFEELWKLRQRLLAEQEWQQAVAQLLGWPTWQNDDTMEYLASLRGGQALEWTLLLQTNLLDSELYVVIPTADLAAARFDRAEATIEHD